MCNVDKMRELILERGDDPNDPESFFKLSKDYYTDKRYTEAINAVNQAISGNTDEPRYHYALGWFYGQIERYAEAIEEYKRAIDLKPDDAGYHYALGWVYDEVGRYTEAIGEFQRAINLKPDEPKYHYALGHSYYHIGNNTDAVNAFRIAVNLRPDDPEYHYMLGWMCSHVGGYEEAIEEYRRAIDLKPDDAGYHYALGWVYDEVGRYVEAIGEYKHAIDLKPYEPKYHYSLGCLYDHVERYEEAIVAYQNAVKNGFHKALIRIGNIYKHVYGDYRQAYYQYQNASRNCADSLDKIEANLLMLRLHPKLPIQVLKEVNPDLASYLQKAVSKEKKRHHKVTGNISLIDVESKALKLYQLNEYEQTERMFVQTVLDGNDDIKQWKNYMFEFESSPLFKKVTVLWHLTHVIYNLSTDLPQIHCDMCYRRLSEHTQKFIEKLRSVIAQYQALDLSIQAAKAKKELACLLNYLPKSHQEALILLDEALDTYSKAKQHHEYAGLLLIRIHILREMGLVGEACASFEEAMKISRDYQDTRLQLRLHAEIAEVRVKSGNRKAAIQSLKSAIEIEETNRLFSANNERIDTRFFRAIDLYDDLIQLYLPDKAKTKDLLECIERRQGRSLNNALRLRIPPPPHLAETYKKHNTVKKQLEKLQRQINVMFKNPTVEEERLEPILNRKGKLLRQLRNYRKQIEADIKGKEFASLAWGELLSADDILKFLHQQYPDRAVIQYYYSRQHNSYFALVIPPQSDPECVILKGPVDDILQEVEDFHRMLAPQEYISDKHKQIELYMSLRDGRRERINEVKDMGERVYKHLFAPVHKQIKLKTKKLIIVSHEDWCNLDFHALYDGSNYVAEKYEISYTPSISALLYASRIRPLATDRALIIAHPEGEGVDSLSSANSLTEYISDIYGADPYIGSDATKANLAKQGPQCSSIWVISHMKYSPDKPMKSAIMLCKHGISGSVKDEVTAQAFLDLQMNLEVDLFVLFGCQSAYGYVEPMANELLGIPRAIIHSGARSFLGASWKIDPVASAEFLKVFAYHYHKCKSKTRALQYAQKLFIEGPVNAFYRDPYFFSAFRLIGAPD